MQKIILTAAAALGLLTLFGAAAAQNGPAGVGVESVEMRSFTETVPVFAEVVTARNGTIAARVAGTVAEIHVLEGADVSEGALLASLDTELAEIELRQAEARLAEIKAGIAVATARRDRLRANFERIESLRGTSFSEGTFEEAQADLLQARGQMAEAEARVLSAEADLAEARYRLARAEIRAPFSGTVLEVVTNPGEYIASGAAVVRMLDTGTLEVEASVPSRYVSAITEGAPVTAETQGGSTLELMVRALLPLEDQATRTRPVRFVSRNGALKGAAVGEAITVNIPAGETRDVISVPKDALVQGGQGWMVFVDEDGAAQPRPVQIGAAVGGWFEVISGLTTGDRVVVRGNERLRPGQPIAARPVGE
ncbi:MAG: efflux RND transporter periplasmic adaptor subunit [Pseudomonadota bacterium]